MKAIKTYNELYELHQHLRKFDVYHKAEKYRLKLPQLNADENNHISNIINSYSKNCGCKTASFFMSTAFAMYIVYYFYNGGTFFSSGWDELIWLTVYTLSGAITGKLFGLVYVRWKMIKFIGKLLTTEHSSLYQADI